MSRMAISLVFISIIGLLFVLNAGCSSDADPVTPPLVSTGFISIDAEPDSVNAPWQLSGPENFLAAGTGDLVLDGLAVGSYTFTWNAIEGYLTPTGHTQALADGDTIIFSGIYDEYSGTIVINQTPDSLMEAGWSLTGPRNETGAGDSTLFGMPVGQYSITWDPVVGWISPSNMSQTLVDDGTGTFDGAYSRDPLYGYSLIPPASVSMPATFTMGDNIESNSPQHQVTMTGRFLMAETEVTNNQFVAALQWAYDQDPPLITASTSYVHDALDGSTDMLFEMESFTSQIGFSSGVFYTAKPDRPIAGVSWFCAVAYCDWLSLQHGLPRAYDHDTWMCNGYDPYTATGFRLPTEAEWEFACRAGTTTPFSTGDCLDAATEANYSGYSPYVGCPAGPHLNRTADVGSYLANPWGLFDMHGNVFEWCNDRFGSYNLEPVDPVGPEYGSHRMLRGGRWNNSASICRSARREDDSPSDNHLSYGFRPVRSLVQ